MRNLDEGTLEKLRCDLLSIGQPSGFLSILIPSIEKIKHDHCYTNYAEYTCIQPDKMKNSATCSNADFTTTLNSPDFTEKAENEITKLCLTPSKLKLLENATPNQCDEL